MSRNQHILLNGVELMTLERVVSFSLTLKTNQLLAIPFIVAVAIAVVTFHLGTLLIWMVWSLHLAHATRAFLEV